MKKLIMMMAFGLFGTATFAQNAASDVSQKEIHSQDQKPIKLKHKLDVKQNKIEAEHQPTKTLRKVNGNKTVMHNSLIKAKLEEEK